MRSAARMREVLEGFRIPLRPVERVWLLRLVDLVAVWVALGVWLSARFGRPVGPELVGRHPTWFVLLALAWWLVAEVFDAYDARSTTQVQTSVGVAVRTALVASGLYLLIPYLSPPLPSSRLALLGLPLLMAVSTTAGRFLYGVAVAHTGTAPRMVIVGAGWAGRTIAETLAESGQLRSVVGFVDDDPEKVGTTVPVQVGNTEATLPVLGPCSALEELIRTQGVSTLVLAITREVPAPLLERLVACLELGVEIVPMPVLYERLTGRVPVEHVGENWYVALPLNHRGTSHVWQVLKRGMDLLLGTLGLAVLVGLLPWVALAIYLDSRGPVFYVQERVGKGGRIFRLYKFRTMVPDAERDGPQWARPNDPRVTRVGRFLRATHLDELPQVLNVLRGEMSAVGPRPERPEFVEELAREIPFYRLRHAVKPGMAGWALVRQGYAASKEDALVRLQYDLYYIKHQSLWLDLVILFKAALRALGLQGRH